ncbi:MAG TPA: Na+/H+ antiporter NhaC family protein [Candidatus Azosocius sp. HAIN]
MISLLPPILILIIGFTTKKVITAIIIGIICASLIANDFFFYDTINMIINRIYNNIQINIFFSTKFWTSYNLFICFFILQTGILIKLIQTSGGTYSYSLFINKYIKNKKQAETSSLLMSSLLCIDDYFSTLTVGSIMQSIVIQKKIAKAKISLLIDSMGAPLTILCPFSSWVAAIIGFFKDNGISDEKSINCLINFNPLLTYFCTIPFLFYSFIIIISIWFIVRKNISFGLMKKCEDNEKKNIYIKKNANPKIYYKKSIINFFLPISILILSIIINMLHSGGWRILGGETFLISLQNASTAKALFLGSITTIIISIIFFIINKNINIQQIPKIIIEGINLMKTPLIILILAWTLGDILRYDLHTGEYIANIISNKINIFLLPSILFIISLIIAFSIGSSWGTAAILFPIVIPLTLSMGEIHNYNNTIEQIPIILPSIGALLSGCVAGDHLSPISDTTIMTSISTKANHIEHVYTQIFYISPLLFITILSFIISGYIIKYNIILSIIIPLIIGILTSLLLLKKLNKQNADDRI